MRSVYAVSLQDSAGVLRRVALLGTILLFNGCGGGDTPAAPVQPVASTVVVAGGDNQHARITRTLADPIVVVAQSANGAAVAGVVVTFAPSGGSVDPSSATTDAAGRATARWTLGATAGAHSLTARLASGVGAPVALSAVADPALDVLITALDGDRQQAIVGTTVFVPPSIRVTERNGSPVADVHIRFSATAGSSVATAEPRTDSDGRATTGAWTMGSAAGTPQVTVTITDGDIVTSAAAPVFTATAVPVGGVATAPMRTYTVDANAPTFVRDTVTGWRLDFPSGGHGTLSVARMVGGPDLPDAGTTRATVSFSGTERVELAVAKPVGGEVDGFFYGQVFDALTSGADTVRWWGLPTQVIRGDTVVFLVQPGNAPALRAKATRTGGLIKSLVAGARPSVQAYATAPVPAGSATMTVRAEFRAMSQRAIDWWLATLSSTEAARLQAALTARPYSISFGRTGESEYWCSLFTGYVPSIYYNTSRGDAAHVTSHEITHYVTHMLAGDMRYSQLLAHAPPAGHDLGSLAMGFRQSLIEEYSHFADFEMNGTLTQYDLRSLSAVNGVRDMMGRVSPSSVDYPSLEGFGGVMLAALTRTGTDTLVYDHFTAGSRTRSPALGVSTSTLLGVLSTGPINPEDLRQSLQGVLGSEQALAAVLEPVGWSYNGLGRVLDDRGQPVAGAEIASVVKVGGTEYRTTGSTLTGADGRFYLPRIYPGTSTLRLYRPRTGGGTDSVNLGPFTVPWTTPTSQAIAMTDLRLAAYEYSRLIIGVGDFIIRNSTNPSEQWACYTMGGANTHPWEASGGPALAPLRWDGANFSASGSVPIVATDWRATHTLNLSGSLRPGTADTTLADIVGSYQMVVEDRRYDYGTDTYSWKLTTDLRSQFSLRDVPLVRSDVTLAAYLRLAKATSVFTSGSLYYFHKDWSHPEYDALCQSSAIDAGRFVVNVTFYR